MPSIADAILQLDGFFKEELESAVSDILNEILNLLKKHSKRTQLTDEDVEKLRKNLTSLQANELTEKIKNENLLLADAVYTTLLILAEYKPIINEKDEDNNPLDPITFEPFFEDKIVFSSGHQFNLDSLTGYHNAREYRGSSLKEQQTKKYLLNPLTNKKFSERDVNHFLKVINEKNTTKLQENKKDIFVIENLKLDNGKIYSTFSSYEEIPLTNFSEKKKTEWKLVLDWWDVYESGADINRYKSYSHYVSDCNCITSICLTGYTDDTYSIMLEAGILIRNANNYFSPLIPTRRIEANKKLMQALQEEQIYDNTSNVVQYPGENDSFSNVLNIRGSLEEINNLLPNVLNVINKLEGESSIGNDIINTLQIPTFNLGL